jgi:hypothetical protein
MWRINTILLITVMAFASCASEAEPEPESASENPIADQLEEKAPSGYLYYQADVDPLNRHQMMDGDFITGSVALSYYSTPGAHDGDGGTDFVFKVLNEEILVASDQWMALSSGDIKAWHINWASPAGYNSQASDSMSGQFRIIEYTKFKSLTMELNFNPEDTQSVRVNFALQSPWVKSKMQNIDWEAYDATSGTAKNSITLDQLQGKYESYEQYYPEKKYPNGEVVREFLVKPEKPSILEVKGSKFKIWEDGNWFPFRLINNRIVETRTDDISVVGIINYIDQEGLVLTWLRGEDHYQRYVFNRK